MRQAAHSHCLPSSVLLQCLPAADLEPNRQSWAVLLSEARHKQNADFAAQVLLLPVGCPACCAEPWTRRQFQAASFMLHDHMLADLLLFQAYFHGALVVR